MRHVLWLWLVPVLAMAQPAFRVRDIRQTADTTTPQPGSDPQGLTALRGGVVFSALRGQEREPWFSDGTVAGTVQLIDAWPGPDSSFPRDFTRVGDKVFFIARVDSLKVADALYVTDGTPAGTRRLRMVAYPGDLAAVGSTLYFTARNSDGVGFALWKSDGTPEGTVPLVRVPGGSESASATAAVDVGGTAFFTLPGTHSELWKSDGTPEGTVRVRTFNNGTLGSLTAVGSTLFFAGSDLTSGTELWKSDGTPEGTVMVRNISAGSASSLPSGLTAVGSTLLFFAQDGVNGYELWKSDGTPEGTVMVVDLRPGNIGSVQDTFRHGIRAVVGSTLYFIAAQDANGSRLWKTDGTAAGTSRITSPAGYTFSPDALAAAGGSVYFASYTGGTGGQEVLWKTDGTTAGTVAVKGLPTGATIIPAWDLFTGSGERLFFIGRTTAAGMELWTSNGTDAGTMPLRDIHRRLTSSEPQKGTALGNVLLFAANDGVNGAELWKTDGTEAGTVLVRDIRAGTASSSPTALTRLGAFVYFVADDGTSGTELWKTDGTAAGTSRVMDLRPGTTGSAPGGLTAWGPELYFIANDGTRGAELWKTDGTQAGTVLVQDIRPGTGSGASVGIQPLAVNGRLYFGGNDGATGWELWKTDGTAAGTGLVRDARPGTEGLSQYDFFTLASAGGRVFIGASSASNSELWTSDGTAVGTYQLGAFSRDSSINTMVAFQGDLFFVADGHQLWRSDSTPLGTYLVKDWNPSAAPRWYEGGLRVVGSTLLFSADDGVYGNELWTSDGTEAGTTRLTDLMPGPGPSVVGPLIASPRLLWFAGSDGSSGVELWQTDGTVQGTRRVHDIASGATSSNPGPVAVAGGKLFFAASDGDGDRELYAHVVDSTPPRIEPRVVGTLGQNGWYTSEVRVSFSASDDESPVDEAGGCRNTYIISTDTSGLTVACTAQSWGGSTTSRVTVKLDSRAPMLSCPTSFHVEATGPDGAVVSFSAPVARDEMDPALVVELSTASGTRLPLGSNNVTVSTRDMAGNRSVCAFMAMVRDTTPPELRCPEKVTVEAATADGATVDFSARAVDIVDGSPPVEYSQAPGSLFPVGDTFVTASATDSSGNSRTCTFPVRVTRAQGDGGGGGEEPQPQPEQGGSGCGCSSTENAPLAVYALLLWVAFSVLRRRARA